MKVITCLRCGEELTELDESIVKYPWFLCPLCGLRNPTPFLSDQIVNQTEGLKNDDSP